MLTIHTYVRKPFTVEAVQATAENLQDIATWCSGMLVEEEVGKWFVKVRVQRVLNDRQTKCYIGDWVLKSPAGYKVYNDKAFHASFQLPDGRQTDSAAQSSKTQPVS